MRRASRRMGQFTNVIFLLLTFFLSFKAVIDPDFGWHLRAGQYIWENHEVPKSDLFSFTLPDYPYVHHSWLSELLVYLSFHAFGLWGVSFLFASIATGGFWLIARRVRHDPTTRGYSWWILLFFVPIVMWVVGMRTQVVTFLLASFIVSLFERTGIKDMRKLMVVPIVFILWANLHGGFILGLFLVIALGGLRALDVVRSEPPRAKARGFSLVSEAPVPYRMVLGKPRTESQKRPFIPGLWFDFAHHPEPAEGKSGAFWCWGELQSGRKRQLLVMLLAIVTLSGALALITPYGAGVYEIALTIASNRFNWGHNLDWKPLILAETHSVVFAGMLYLGVLATLLSRQAARREKLLIALLFFLSLVSRHYVMPLLVFLLPPIVRSCERMFAQLNRGRTHSFPLRVAVTTVIIAYIGVGVRDLMKMRQAYSSPEYYATGLSRDLVYPYGAVRYMQEHGIPRRLLNDIAWGGYLIWQFPGERFFIDGRMENFFIDGRSFAQDYWTIINVEPGWKGLFDSYQIGAVLAPTQAEKTWPLLEVIRWDDGWDIVWEDAVSLLAVKRSDQ